MTKFFNFCDVKTRYKKYRNYANKRQKLCKKRIRIKTSKHRFARLTDLAILPSHNVRKKPLLNTKNKIKEYASNCHQFVQVLAQEKQQN